MSVKTTIVVTHGSESVQTVKDRFQKPGSKPREQAIRVRNFFDAAAIGGRRASFAITVDNGTSVKATVTLTLTGACSVNDTILINGATLTAVASGASATQFNVGSSASDQATKLAAAINAASSALINGHVTAAAVGAVVTITSVFNSVAGNAVTTAKGVDGGSVMTFSGSRLTGGVNPPTATSYQLA